MARRSPGLARPRRGGGRRRDRAAVQRVLGASTSTAGGGFTFASAGDATSVASGILGGQLAVSVVADVHGTGEDPPEAGAVRIAASDGTSLALEVAPGGAVTLALDDDGDGVVDATIPAAWTDLR